MVVDWKERRECWNYAGCCRIIEQGVCGKNRVQGSLNIIRRVAEKWKP